MLPALARLALLVGAVAAVVAGCGNGGSSSANGERQREVAARGAQVMPFDLDGTTHTFRPTRTGGVQTVTVDDPRDDHDRTLVRDHLRSEAERFARGDLGDQAEIHGHDMPGLATIEAHAADIRVAYGDVPDGGRITYTTDDPELVAAIHDWFDAQLSDHGAQAQHG
jgi:hypothetical protein